MNIKESFVQLLEESIKNVNIRPGSIIRGTVISISKNIVLVDAGLKSESIIPIEQFHNAKGELEISVGDQIDVTLDSIEDGFGETVLSREKAKRHERWIMLEKAYKENTTILGIVNGKVKGGFTVELNGIRAFLPGSLVDIRPIRDCPDIDGKELEFKVIKLDQKRNNIVVSRRAVIESENFLERNQFLENLKEGMQIKGIIKNLTDYGAFIDLGGIDGLLHITDISWKRVKHPSEMLSIGEEIITKVLKFDRERTRVSLGLKQLFRDPWLDIFDKFPKYKKTMGKITNLTDYGCFVEISDGIEGLVHISEMNWINKNIHPSKIVNVNDKVEVMVLDIDQERRRISLGMKQCTVNPWKKFAELHDKGDKILGRIKSITDFGIFIELDEGIDGLVHLSDISWNEKIEEVIKNYKKGDEIYSVILQIDPDRERISLGIKQMTEDPFINIISRYKIGSIVNCKIISHENKRIKVKVENIADGYLEVKQLHQDLIDFDIGSLIKAKISEFDKKNRILNLSYVNEKIIEESDCIKKNAKNEK